MKSNVILIAVLLSSIAFQALGQSAGTQTLNVSGGGNTIAGKTYEYSIGEATLVNTATGSNIIVTQGLLQPAQQQTGIHEHEFFNDHFSIYPNPSEDIVFFQPAFSSAGKLSFQLFDALGRIMKSGSFQLNTGHEKQSLSLAGLASGTYSLSVSFDQKDVSYKTAYKIQKIK